MDLSTSIRLSPRAIKQLEDLKEKFGENRSKIVIRAVDLLHGRQCGGKDNETNRARKSKRRSSGEA